MFLLASVILSIIIGYIRGGKLRYFENVTIKLWYLISVAFLIQTIALVMPQINDTIFYVLHIISYVIIMYVCYINRHIISVAVMGFGTLLNMIVIAFNSGTMPVKVPDYIMDPVFDRGHSLMTEATNVSILGDIFLVDLPLLGGGVLSIGDIFLVIGAFMLIQHVMTYKGEEQQTLQSAED